jgi:hypothetical protein
MSYWIGILLLLATPAVGLFLGPAWGTTAIQNVILLATGAVILLYTYETHEMRREMIRQNALAVQPLVLASTGIREIGQRIAWRVILRNVGKGPAVSIRVDDFVIVGMHVGERITLNVPSADCLMPGEEVMYSTRQVIEQGGRANTAMTTWQ